MYRVASHRAPLALALIAFATIGFCGPLQAASRSIIYIGAEDCAPCHQWEATYERSFAAQCAALGVKFRSVRVATLRNIRDPRYWPNDLRPLLAQFSDRTGTPHFLAVRNGEVIVNVYGLSRYRSDIATLMERRR